MLLRLANTHNSGSIKASKYITNRKGLKMSSGVMQNKDDNKEVSLKGNEKIIEKGLDTFKEVGEALARIKDKKLYRASHSNFGDYCKAHWHFTQQHARRLINAAKIVKEIGSEPNDSVFQRQKRKLENSQK